MAGTTCSSSDWSILDGAETVTSFTIEPSEADARDKEICLLGLLGCVQGSSLDPTYQHPAAYLGTIEGQGSQADGE